MPHVVMFLPGIMGSVLKLGEDVIWPGSVSSLVLPYKKMPELLMPNLVATDCIRSFVMPQYQSLLDDLTAWGFDEQAGTLVVVPYDWRKPIQETAQTIGDALATVLQRHGVDVEVSLVAHSMGGLLSRYFLECGKFNGHPGWGRVVRLITLGTPHRGATIALPLVLGMEKKLFLSKDQVRLLASDVRYPGAYQLLPAPSEPIAWDDAPGQALALRNIYAPDIIAKLDLQPANLKQAELLHAIFIAGVRPAHVRYFCFSGNRETTVPFVKLRPTSGERLEPAKQEVENGGDGTVPNWSSTLPGAQFLYVAGEHGTIYKNHQLRRTLALLLGCPSLLAAGAPTEIWLREPVVNPFDVIHARLTLPAGVTELLGRVVIERMGMTLAAPMALVSSDQISYKGPEIDNFNVLLRAPVNHGIYRVAYYDTKGVGPASSAEIIVQESIP